MKDEILNSVMRAAHFVEIAISKIDTGEKAIVKQAADAIKGEMTDAETARAIEYLMRASAISDARNKLKEAQEILRTAASIAGCLKAQSIEGAEMLALDERSDINVVSLLTYLPSALRDLAIGRGMTQACNCPNCRAKRGE